MNNFRDIIKTSIPVEESTRDEAKLRDHLKKLITYADQYDLVTHPKERKDHYSTHIRVQDDHYIYEITIEKLEKVEQN